MSLMDVVEHIRHGATPSTFSTWNTNVNVLKSQPKKPNTTESHHDNPWAFSANNNTQYLHLHSMCVSSVDTVDPLIVTSIHLGHYSTVILCHTPIDDTSCMAKPLPKPSVALCFVYKQISSTQPRQVRKREGEAMCTSRRTKRHRSSKQSTNAHNPIQNPFEC